MKLDNILNQTMDILKRGELNLREKANIYGGALLGLFSPIIATRYLFFGFGPEESPEKEALKWVYSLAAAPSVAVGLPLGIVLGTRSAKSLKGTREEEERHEKALVKKVLYI